MMRALGKGYFYYFGLFWQFLEFQVKLLIYLVIFFFQFYLLVTGIHDSKAILLPLKQSKNLLFAYLKVSNYIKLYIHLFSPDWSEIDESIDFFESYFLNILPNDVFYKKLTSHFFKRNFGYFNNKAIVFQLSLVFFQLENKIAQTNIAIPVSLQNVILHFVVSCFVNPYRHNHIRFNNTVKDDGVDFFSGSVTTV